MTRTCLPMPSKPRKPPAPEPVHAGPPFSHFGKAPRHWAAEIADLPTRAERNARLLEAPEDWQPLIRSMVGVLFALRTFEKQRAAVRSRGRRR